MKPLKLLIALSCVAALATAGAAFGQSAHASAASVIVKTSKTKFGTILVTSSGLALYLNTGDKPGHFACTGGCLAAWPPLKATGPLKALGAAKAANLAKVKGPGGIKMVTYKGHPLYTFTSDSKGSITGEGVNSFFVVSPSGAKITKAAKTTTTTSTSSSSGGGYKY